MTMQLWQWTAAAQAAATRGEPLKIARVMVPAYVITLQDGTAMPYRDHETPRAFRDIGQATTAILNQRLPLNFVIVGE